MASIGVERERSNESIIACRLLSYELLLPLRSCPPSVFSGMETNASASLPSMPEKTKEPSSYRSIFPPAAIICSITFPTWLSGNPVVSTKFPPLRCRCMTR